MVGQGALAVECRADEAEMINRLSVLHDRETAVCVAAERGVMIAVGGSCQVPIAAYACRDEGGLMRLRAMLASGDGAKVRWAEHRLPWPQSEGEGTEVGMGVGGELLLSAS